MAKFIPEDKIAATILYLEGNESLTLVGNSIGTTANSVKNWISQYIHHGEQAFIKTYTSIHHSIN